MDKFESLLGEMDKSIIRVGNRMTLSTEAGVHHYILPVFNMMSDFFEGRAISTPEVLLTGELGSEGRLEFTYVLVGCSMLLLIELKYDLRQMSRTDFSNIVAQICAEADAASVQNEKLKVDHSPVDVILTDAVVWHFVLFDFSKMFIWRGMTTIEGGYLDDLANSIMLPVSEIGSVISKRVKCHCHRVLTVVETVSDTFLAAYCSAIDAILTKYSKELNVQNDFLCSLVQARKFGNKAHEQLRLAHLTRLDDNADDLAKLGLNYLSQSVNFLENENLRYLHMPRFESQRARLAKI